MGEATGGRGCRRRVRVWQGRRKRVSLFSGGASGADERRGRGRVGSCTDGSEARRRKKGAEGVGGEAQRVQAWVGPKQ